jgi:hypothetical protein
MNPRRRGMAEVESITHEKYNAKKQLDEFTANKAETSWNPRHAQCPPWSIV